MSEIVEVIISGNENPVVVISGAASPVTIVETDNTLHNLSFDLQGGTTNQYYHFTSGEHEFLVIASGYCTNAANITGYFNKVNFNTGYIAGTEVGQMHWNNDFGSLDVGLLGGTVESHLGQDVTAYVRNAESVTIPKGRAVYLYSAQGDKASVKFASNISDTTSSKTLGITTQDIAAGSLGYIKSHGVVEKLNLGDYNAGDILWLGSQSGTLTTTKPQAPYHMVFIGVVERANNGNGQLYVKIQNGYEIEELHDVRINYPVPDNSILVYNAGSGVWHDANILELNSTGNHYVSGSFSIGSSGTPNTRLLIDSPNTYTGSLIDSRLNGENKFKVDYKGNVICGPKPSVATNATNGFIYVPTCSGTPIGTPEAYNGVAPIVIDVLNNKLYFYSNGIWRDSANT